MYPEDLIREFERSFDKAKKAASDRPWAHPARLPDHPDTHSDRTPYDPPEDAKLFLEYF